MILALKDQHHRFFVLPVPGNSYMAPNVMPALKKYQGTKMRFKTQHLLVYDNVYSLSMKSPSINKVHAHIGYLTHAGTCMMIKVFGFIKNIYHL